MNLIKTMIAAVALASSFQAHTATVQEDNKTISQLIAFSSGTAYLTLNNPDTIDSSNCGPYSLVKVEIDTPNKRLVYSTLLAAKTANQPIYIVYDDHNNSTDCTLKQVNLKNF